MTRKKKGGKGNVKRTCQFETPEGKPCGRELYDGEHCIFHSEDIEGKKDKFNNAFEKEFERQKKDEKEYDFTGFVFPGDISFKDLEFEKDAYFWEAQFSGEADFEVAQFSGVAYFEEAQFSGDAFFRGAQFSGRANFERAQFSRVANFWEAQFSGGADFDLAQFSGVAKFIYAQFSGEASFIVVKFSGGAEFDLAQFSGEANFERAQFSGVVHFTGAEFFGNAGFNSFRYCGKVSFREVKFYKRVEFQRTCYRDEDVNNLIFEYTYIYNEKGLFDFIKNNKEKFNYSKKTKLEFLPDNFKLILGEEIAARDPTTTRKVRDDMFLLKLKDEHPNWFKAWWLSSDCGRSFFQWALWSLILSEAFAIVFGIFYYCNPISFKSEVISFSWPGISLLYYSIVTFTTLGFGDIVPKIPVLQIIIMLEVILGYIMLDGLISILANKLARRS